MVGVGGANNHEVTAVKRADAGDAEPFRQCSEAAVHEVQWHILIGLEDFDRAGVVARRQRKKWRRLREQLASIFDCSGCAAQAL